MKVILTNKARKNLNEIFEYIAKDFIKYAIETDKNIRSYIRQLEVFPYIGRYVPEISSKLYRERIYQNYRIIYFISEKTDTVYVQFIFHVKQDFNSFYKFYLKDFLDF